MDNKKEKYLTYIKKRFPKIKIDSINYNFQDGLNNDIVIINNSKVFRFAKNQDIIDSLEHEIKIINIAKEYVDMPLPDLEYIEPGIAKSNFFHGTPIFRNELLMLDDEQQNNLAKQIGCFLKQLHSIPMEIIKENEIKAFPGNGVREDFISQFHIIEEKLFPMMKSYTREHITQIYKPLIENELFLLYEPALIHGDLAPFHFFYSKEQNKINGVIDFGSSGYGDPAHDLGVILDNFGEGFIKKMSMHYPEINSFIDRSRFYATISSLWWALRGFESNDLSWHLLHLHTARDIMPIGLK
ncbi:phosphotransferase family protein [Clostridium cellulovorans]|uniref:Aminoglycoside phosphotransferase n=1 Tax=Clostridium cellulovorans (strain ATCC 35296 / DSM 3052 / OCM 3 / 743B) TaxID=573061 RepID=D9SKS3_CLOC7|nr:aminoglycoside phosphotransferase family protein [Clostridium cellulovorans]ADL53495.1 aminoglycoside phosphotransferase [Clostridium cellulovorans 743B]